MLSPRPDKASSAMRHLIIFCLAVCLSRPAVLLAQTNNVPGLFGNRTTGGANQGTNSSPGVSGNRSTGGASPAPSGNLAGGTQGNSGGNIRSPGENGFGPTGSPAARRARMEAASAGGNKGQAHSGFAFDIPRAGRTLFRGRGPSRRRQAHAATARQLRGLTHLRAKRRSGWCPRRFARQVRPFHRCIESHQAARRGFGR